MSLLELTDLSVAYTTNRGRLKAVQEASFSIEEGETFGLVGESGCGKSTIAKSILGLLGKNGSITNGSIQFKDNNLASFSERDYRKVRWSEISYISQTAMNALDPVYTIGQQFRELFKVHTNFSKSAKIERTRELLDDVGLDSGVENDFPHELSGGQRQRAIIALALALEPDLVIADEPTTGLDVVVQEKILDLIKEIQSRHGSSMIFITHDISAVAETADRIGVMYGGQLVEQGRINEVLKNSSHPYTMGLRNAFPSLDTGQELVSIPGQPPDLIHPPTGCVFVERCPFATSECETKPVMEKVNPDHEAKCHYIDQADDMREQSKQSELWDEIRPGGMTQK